MPDPTPAQRKAIKALKETYGSKNVKAHAADALKGHVRVELVCEAGIWHWFYDRNGLYLDGSLTQRLFEPDPPPHKPGNALDN
jgi:nitrate reductase alpha subunit